MKRVLLPILILVFGFGLAALIIISGPKLEQKAPVENSPLVRTWTAQPQSVQLSTIAHGIVTPRTESDLIPEVSGRVTKLSPAMVSGGFFTKGQLLFEIDALDYEVALEQAKAAIASTESELNSANRAHTRQQNLALKQSTSESMRDDALNRLRIAEANHREAKARHSRARRDLSRTRIKAPYDGRVRSERVDVGQFVMRGTAVANLYATDFAEVRLPIHDEELAFLDLPLNGQSLATELAPKAILHAKFAGQQHSWQAAVVRTEGELDPQTRMINIVAQVTAPYEATTGRPPLSVGLFVEAEVFGTQVDNVYVLPRSAIQANTKIYVVDADNTLQFRPAKILRIVKDKVYVTGGLKPGETVCLSTLNNAVAGMSVRPTEEIAQTTELQKPERKKQ